jgi:DNA-binding MarR family transcriptional regulator
MDAAGLTMGTPDDIIHQPLRLRVMAALTALPRGEGLDFTTLKSLTGATDGNLGAHIETLSRSGYVDIDKSFVAKRPRTTVTATPAGRGAFARHVLFLREIIDAAADAKT